MPPGLLESSLRNTVVTLLLALVAAALWLATWQRQGTTPAVERNDDAPPLGYYVHGARMTGTDEQGRVTYRVLAERLDEVPEEDRLQLTGVSIEYRPPEDTAWSLSAASASSPKSGSPLDLAGNVEIKSVPTDGSQPRAIDTETLRFWPDTSIAETDAPVRFRVGDWLIEGVRLRGNLKEDTLRLESSHGIFAPR
jgi:LPS export ABC transporter protein LptC